MRYIVIFWICCCGIAQAQQTDLNSTALAILQAFKQADANKINHLINDDIGLIVLYRRGAELGSFTVIKKLDFAQPVPEYLPFDTHADYPKVLTHSKLPTFDCGTERWSKQGVFYHQLGADRLFTQVLDFAIKYQYINLEQKTYKTYQAIEKNSYRIVAVNNTRDSLVFYLTKIANKWYLTIIDRLSDDCSA